MNYVDRSKAIVHGKSHNWFEGFFTSLTQKLEIRNPSRGASNPDATLLFVIAVIQLLLCIGVANAQEVPPPEEPVNASSDKSHSLRGTIYKKSLKRIEDDGFESQFNLRLSLAVYEAKFLRNLADLNFQSYGLRPRLNFKVPTPIKHTSFVPSLEAAATYERQQNLWLVSGSVYLGLDYDDEREDSNVGASVGLKYGTRYEDDGFNPSDYLEFQVEARFRQNLKWKIKEHTTTLTPFVKASYFLDNLEYGTDELITGDRRRRYEIGVRGSTLPRIRLIGIRVPELRVSYFFGDGVKGFKVRF